MGQCADGETEEKEETRAGQNYYSHILYIGTELSIFNGRDRQILHHGI